MFSKQQRKLNIGRALAFTIETIKLERFKINQEIALHSLKLQQSTHELDQKLSKVPLFVLKNKALNEFRLKPKREAMTSSILNETDLSENEDAYKLLQKVIAGRLAWIDVEQTPVQSILSLLEQQQSMTPSSEATPNDIPPNSAKPREKENYWTIIDAYDKAIRFLFKKINSERSVFLNLIGEFKKKFSANPPMVEEALGKIADQRPFCQNNLSGTPISYDPLTLNEIIFPCFKTQGTLMRDSVMLPVIEKLNFDTWCQRPNLSNPYLFAAVDPALKVYARKANFEFFTQIHADSIVQQLSQMSLFPFEYQNDGCYAISLVIKQMLLVLGIPAENIYSLTITSWVNEKMDLDLAIFHENKRIGFSYHVAPCISVKGVYYVIDPALFKNKSVDPIIWANKVRKDSVYNQPIRLEKQVFTESKFSCVFRQHSLFLSPLTSDPYRLELYENKSQKLHFIKADDTSSIVNALIKLGCFGRRAERNVLEAKGELEAIEVGLHN